MVHVCTVIGLFFFSRWDPDSAVQLCAQVRYTCTTYYLLRTTRYDSCVRTTYTYFIHTVYIIHYTSVYMTYKIYKYCRWSFYHEKNCNTCIINTAAYYVYLLLDIYCCTCSTSTSSNIYNT